MSNQEEKDDLFQEAKEFVMSKEYIGCSDLQRKFKLGYNRAGRIIDQLEEDRVIGEYEHPKGRKVLIKEDSKIKTKMSNTPIKTEKEVLNEVCWRSFGQTFDTLFDGVANHQSAHRIITDAMQEYASQFTPKPISEETLIAGKIIEVKVLRHKTKENVWGATYQMTILEHSQPFILDERFTNEVFMSMGNRKDYDLVPMHLTEQPPMAIEPPKPITVSEEEIERLSQEITGTQSTFAYSPTRNFKNGVFEGIRKSLSLSAQEGKEEGWISVEDRLPPFNKNVLAISNIGWIKITFVDSEGKLDVYELEGDEGYRWTHWQPLPAPPKQKS